MSECLALISGKGGSGKTTIALSIAKMISSCKKRVLLIDCDLSTHGGTYFFEHLLKKDSNNILSFHDVLKRETVNKTAVEVSDNLDFIPSVTQLPLMIEETNDNENISNYFRSVITVGEYDLVIFDCQAGYTKILDEILELSDCVLTVLEADAISSSSIRALFSQISNITEKKKVFQIFNKVTQEERDIYSKISAGTLFTNLPPLLFDWEVRKAFAISKVPEIGIRNPKYTIGINGLCRALFPIFARELEEIILEILEFRRKELYELVSIQKKEDKRRDFLKMTSICIMFISFLSFALIMLTFILEPNQYFFSSSGILELLTLSLVIMGLLLTISLSFDRSKKSGNSEKENIITKVRIYDLNDEIKEIESHMNSL